MAVTDGAGSLQVDPGGRESVWESVLAEGITATGIDPSASFESSDDPAGDTPQPEFAGGSSEGAGTSGSPVAPAASAPGDGGPSNAAPAISPPAAVSKTPPDPGSASPANPAADPLAGAQPFTYTVGDETRTMEGAFRIPGEGLYVPEDKVPQFQLIASRAETLDRQNRDLYDRHSTLERASAWTTRHQDGFKPDGQPNIVEKTITGPQAVEQWRLTAAQASAFKFEYERSFDAMVKDPAQFGKLYSIVTDEEGQYGPAGTQYVVPNPQGFEDLKRGAQTFARETALNMREQFPKVIAAPPPPETPVSERAMPTINELIKVHQLKDLTDGDKQFLVGQFGRYVVMSKEGPMIDPQFVEVVKDRAALRAEQKKVASTAETAGKFNGGMNRGRSLPRPAAPAAPSRAPAPAEKVGKQAAWDNVLHSALQEISV